MMNTEGYQLRSGRLGCALLLIVLVLLGVWSYLHSASDKARWAAERAAAPFHIVALAPGKSLRDRPIEDRDGVGYFPDGIDDFAAAVDGDLESYRRLRLTTKRRTPWWLSFRVPYDGKSARQVDPETLKLGKESAFARDILVRPVLNTGASKVDDFKGFPGNWISRFEVFYDPVVDAYYGCSEGACEAQFVGGRYMIRFGFDGDFDRPVVRKVIGDVRRALPRWEAVPKSVWCREDDGCRASDRQ